jgi:flagellar motor switch protein FliG
MTEATANRNDQQQSSSGRSRLEQAAILLMSVGEEAAAQVMQKLNREEVVLLSETMARLHDVKVHQARQAMNNFFSDYREQSGINGPRAPTCAASWKRRWAARSPAA